MLNQLISSPLQHLLPIGKKSYGVYMLAVMLIKLRVCDKDRKLKLISSVEFAQSSGNCV